VSEVGKVAALAAYSGLLEAPCQVDPPESPQSKTLHGEGNLLPYRGSSHTRPSGVLYC